MKIKFYSDDNLPLNKTIEIPIVNSYSFLDECLIKYKNDI